MNFTKYFNLNKAEATDKFNELTINNPAMDKVDAQMYKNQNASVQPATHSKSGTVHNIVKEISESTTFKFVATGDYQTGDTFTVDGQPINARLTDGTTLPNNAFRTGNNVMVIQGSGVLTVLISSSAAVTAEKLSKPVNIGKASFDGSKDVALNEIGALPHGTCMIAVPYLSGSFDAIVNPAASTEYPFYLKPQGDTPDCYTISGANVTVKKKGVYRISTALRYTGSAKLEAKLYKNASLEQSRGSLGSDSIALFTIAMEENDSVQVSAVFNSSGTTSYADKKNAYFYIERVG